MAPLVHYRGCNTEGLRFDSLDHTVTFGAAPRTIKSSPRSPDVFGDLSIFSSGEDPGLPGFGLWGLRVTDPDCWKLPGVTWRSWYPGRFDPFGKYWFSGKAGDSKQFPNSGRGAVWTFKNGTLVGPRETGTTSIEGISDFEPVTNDDGEIIDWYPIWQNRGKPITVDGYKLPIWFRTPNWLYGVNSPTDRSIAKDLRTGKWYLVTTFTSQVAACVKEQPDGSLLVAWNASLPSKPISFLSSNDGWTELPTEIPPPDPNPEPEPVVSPQTKYPRPIFFAPYDVYAKPQYGNSDRPIGNVAFPWLDSMADSKPLPLIVGFDTYVAAELNRTLYYYIHAPGSNSWAEAKKQWDVLKTKPERPVILYFDGRNWPDALPDWLPKDRAFLGVQAYPNPNETPAQFKAAMGTLFKEVAKFGLPIVLTPCFYNRNGALSLEQIRNVMYVYDELVFDFKIVGIMPFSDMRTGQGMAAFPELYDDAQRMMNAVPARPNRYTYWAPSDLATAKQALKDQVRYEISGFSKKQADKLCQLIDDHYTEDD